MGGERSIHSSTYICTVNNNKVIRVAIFEDNPIMMDAYRSILNGSPGYTCCGCFTNGNNWKHDIQKSNPDVVLMDIEMTGIDGIAATQLIKNNFAAIKILIQTVFEDDAKIFEALCAGANGYILKNTSPIKMLEAVADVQNGGVAFNPVIAGKVVKLFQQFIVPSLTVTDYQLTAREREILHLLTEGMPMPRIAEKIFLSYETVRGYVKSIYQKLHVASATEAVSKALKEKIV
ncbi:MAG: response regulator transcription factor [Sphingobacteriales bacterium]|nr:response regulator transcription factor [Sphingobacteriales bacterium]